MSIAKTCRLLACTAGLAMLVPAYADPLHLEPTQLRSLGIETLQAGNGSSGSGATFPARVTVPNAQMRVISAPVAGLVEMLAVAPGSTVKRGQVLAHLASPQALELQRDVLQSSSQSDLQQQNLKRDEQLFAEGLISESRLQATRAASAQASAFASERRQGLALAGVAPGKLGGPLALVAPIDGVVLEQGAQLGQRVDASAPIYRIAKLRPLWLEIQVPLDVATGLKEGQAVRIAGSQVSGKLQAIGRAVDAASQTVLVRAVVDQGAETLIPGQAIETGFDNINRAGLRLPAAALIRNAGTTLVFIQTAANDKGSQFEARTVRIVGQGGSEITVEGVKPGERVVTKGVSGLKAMLSGVGKE